MENLALVLDLVEWIARNPRPYEEVIENWRTSCPRLPIWEDAVDDGLVVRRATNLGVHHVCVTDKGLAFLRAGGRLGATSGNRNAESAIAFQAARKA